MVGTGGIVASAKSAISHATAHFCCPPSGVRFPRPPLFKLLIFQQGICRRRQAKWVRESVRDAGDQTSGLSRLPCSPPPPPSTTTALLHVGTHRSVAGEGERARFRLAAAARAGAGPDRVAPVGHAERD